MKIKTIVLLVLLISPLNLLSKKVYSIIPMLNVRAKPTLNSKIIGKVRHTRWIKVLEKGKRWYKIALDDGQKGYVRKDKISDTWLKIYKKERKLLLMKGNKAQKTFDVAFGFNPIDDKISQGDVATPEGRFFICETLKKPEPAESYGPVSLRISYPNIEDARRGLYKGLINKKQYLRIIKAIHRGSMPPQNTKLGSSIKIHGGKWGVSKNWTLGCVAMKNREIVETYSMLPKRLALVEIYRSMSDFKRSNNPLYINKRITFESKNLLKQKCSYTRSATRIIKIKYPMGDFDKSIGVCTDVVIRGLRRVGIDLQALLHEDIVNCPKRYKSIIKPDTNIDHRRCRNLQIFFNKHSQVLTTKPPSQYPNQWKAGDIVIMDTGVSNGTIYDHIGIVSSKKIAGIPLVINSWSIGHQLNEMELLNGKYPRIVGHFRLHNHLYYDTKDTR